MHTDTFAGQETVVNRKLRLFSLYVDFAASAHARWTAIPFRVAAWTCRGATNRMNEKFKR